MLRAKAILALLSVCTIVLVAGAVRARDVREKLSAEDQLGIRQLIEAYPNILDTCMNGGYGYADQYTPDGTFGVSSAWGNDGYAWFKGREQLAVAAGGGPDGCRKIDTKHHHLALSPVITATPTGARAVSTLLMITDGSGDKPSKIEWQGGYEDTFVKAQAGWRFKSRRHVWPGYDWPSTAAEMAARLAKERAND